MTARPVIARFHGGPLDGLAVVWNTAQPDVVGMPIPRTVTTTRYRATRKTQTQWHYTEEAP